jgi:hypothetical protein
MVVVVARKRIKTYVKGHAVISAIESMERYLDSATIVGNGYLFKGNAFPGPFVFPGDGYPESGSADTFQGKDTGKVTAAGVISSIENFSPIQLSTVNGIARISAVEFRDRTDTTTVTGIGVPSHTETRFSTDAGTTTGIGVVAVPSTANTFQAVDSYRVYGKGIISDTFQYTDAATVIGVAHTTEIIGDFHAVDAGTLTAVGIPSGVDIAQFRDGDFDFSSTYPSGDSYPGSPMYPLGIDTPIGKAVISSTDTIQAVDTATVIGVANIYAGHYDVGTVTGVAVLDSFENFVFTDTATVIGLGEVYGYSVFPSSLFFPGSSSYPAGLLDVYERTIESITITGAAVITALENHINADSSVTPVGVAVISSTEAMAFGRTGAGIVDTRAAGVKNRNSTKTGSGVTAGIASGAKSRTIANQITGYVGGGSVTGATNATPIVLTVPTGHGINNTDRIIVSGVGGNTAANGLFKAASVSATTVSLTTEAGANVAGSGAYTSGGLALSGYTQILSISTATNASPSVLTAATAHGLIPGDIITVVGAVGNTAINGTWQVVNDANYSATTFTMRGPTAAAVNGNGAYTASSANMAKLTAVPYVNAITDFSGISATQKYT